ncbi:MAG: leucine--tRNA ligase, partial [Pirellulaceae bacterium]|nr:leucine--tRNA ligase [Pirellulaceae bacterium]
PLRQWMLRITAYAERLEDDLALVDWPESIKKLQRDWIGRSQGAEVDFFIGAADEFDKWKSQRAAKSFPRKPGDDVLRIYTTRPDTLFGATYMVIAPEHPFVERLTTDRQRADVTAYCERAAAKSDRERTEERSKVKTGVFTGSYAINPVNGEATPIWIADYVLISYGTGAIMAVPAHDTRDFEFAQQFDIPITAVVDPGDAAGVDRAAVLAGEECFVGVGVGVNSAHYDGVGTTEFKTRIAADLDDAGMGRKATNFKLRDWLFSRQRFWGEPFPILHELDGDGNPTGRLRPVPEADLPVDLPHLDDYKPHGRPEPPLAKAGDEWLYVTLDGIRYRRETNTMPQWAGSCWYYLRFIDNKNGECFVSPDKEKSWMSVDLYVGGAEHAVLHLLYSRFWHKVLFDRGHVSTPEPFKRLVNQGMILGPVEYTSYQNSAGDWITATEVAKGEGGTFVHKSTGEVVEPQSIDPADTEKQGEAFVLKADAAIHVDSRAHKMAKSRGNTVNPDSTVEEYGADALRMYEMFMGPLEATKPWSMQGLNGVRLFLDRVWRMIVDDGADELTLHEAVRDVAGTAEQERLLHHTIKQVTSDTESLGFNTAIARMMEFTNFFTKQQVRPLPVMRQFVLLLAPYAPHMAEELWELMGGGESLSAERWPAYDEAKLKEDTIEVPVQINGKLKARIQVAPDLSKDELEQAARAATTSQLEGKQVVKVIVVPGRMVNIVVRDA